MTTSLANHNLCQVTLLGNLVSKPDIRYLANPVVAIAEVVLATHSRWFDKASNQYKEWTDFHTIKVIGDVVETALLYAEKGDVMLINGYLLNSKKTNREIIHATFAQHFAKGYAQSINLVQLSGTLNSDVRLLTSAQGKTFAEANLAISHKVYSTTTGQWQQCEFERPIHIWGKQASYLAEHAEIGNPIVIEGKLSYLKNADKSQYIDTKQTVLLKN